MNRVNNFIKDFGWARIIIGIFLCVLFAAAPIFGLGIDASFNDVIVRFGQNAILVLAMVPMIQSGCGLNFGIPVGLVAGLLGSVLSLELMLTGFLGFVVAIAIGIIAAVILGYGYGKLLNKVKGDEMIIATYVGFSIIYFMSILWIILPFKNPASVQSYKGTGLRVIISVENYWYHVLNDFLHIHVTKNFIFPTGMIMFFIIMALIVWALFKTKTGTAITAVGSNPEYARAAGINVDKMRTISVIWSTVIAAIGIVVYYQSFGFIQSYAAPLAYVFPSVAAVLLGGASVNKASIANVIIGTILFQGIVTMTPAVINSAIKIDIAEVLRLIISYGMIVYALTRRGR
ncbi:MAG: ABC transporter permease [Bacillota bacterium]|nr:ABC transporter permease [Bacillota bacterium]